MVIAENRSLGMLCVYWGVGWGGGVGGWGEAVIYGYYTKNVRFIFKIVYVDC